MEGPCLLRDSGDDEVRLQVFDDSEEEFIWKFE